jgi:hypothetical protein
MKKIFSYFFQGLIYIAPIGGLRLRLRIEDVFSSQLGERGGKALFVSPIYKTSNHCNIST